jgi:flagellar motor switch protein FliN/FliY
LLDQTFSFPWKEFAESFGKVMGVTLELSPGTIEWKERKNIYESLSPPHISVPIALPGIPGFILLVVSKSDFLLLLENLLHVSADALSQQDPSFFDQFLAFFYSQLIACTQDFDQIKALSPRITGPQDMSFEGYLSLDIAVTLPFGNSLARLLVTPEFLDGWRKKRLGEEPTPASLLTDVETTLCVEAGRTFLTAEEITNLHTGDFLLLNHPFFIPESERARIFLTYKGRPLFRGNLKDGKIKILEMPLQHEAFTPLGGHSMAQSTSSAKGATPNPLTRPQHSEDESSHEEHEDEELKDEPFEESPEENEETAELTEAEALKIQGLSINISNEPLQIEKIPLPVVVQLAELTMTLGEISSLQPGNLLDLDVRPENGVCLVVNGRIFANGELVLIGENVGVRIKEIGQQPSPS